MKNRKHELPFKTIDEIAFRFDENKLRNLNAKLISRRFMEKNYPNIKEWEWFIGTMCIWDDAYDETCYTGEYIITIYEKRQ